VFYRATVRGLVGGNGQRWHLARFAPLVEGRLASRRTALLPHAAREHLARRGDKRNRLPSAFPRSSPIENPLQGIGTERPITRNGKLSLAHAAPPRWRRTLGGKFRD